MPRINSDHVKLFKNSGKSLDVRKRRLERSVELRKQKRDEQLSKRRQIDESVSNDSLSDVSIVSSEKDGIQAIEKLLMSNSEKKISQGAQLSRQILSKVESPLIQEFIDRGIMLKLVSLLEYNNETVQFESAWALTNIASGNSEQTQCVVKAGALTKLINLLKSNNMILCEQAIWAIGNISGDGSQMRDLVINLDVISYFENFTTKKMSLTFCRTLSWALSNLCRNKNPFPPEWAVKKLINLMHTLIEINDSNVHGDICWAVSYLTDGPDERIKVVMSSGLIPKIVNLFNHYNILSILTPIIRVVGNIVSGNDEHTRMILNYNILSKFPNILRDHNKSLSKELMWTVSNIAAGKPDQIEQIIISKLTKPIIKCFKNGNYRTKNECIWIINNISTCGTIAQLQKFIDRGVLYSLKSCFEIADDTMTLLLIDTIYALLKNCSANNFLNEICLMVEESGLLDLIEDLQHSEHPDIYKSVLKLIQSFFYEESD
ncbi:Importin subunit alpha-8 [Intoshia linei]|uniref:Importin subunit alpha n=1 Tax=Intoshia linei TaxID=1819745 RepID=A0A177B5I2_9BILA|nr:Importin subunit alpha-8 [Intoshia linei]